MNCDLCSRPIQTGKQVIKFGRPLFNTEHRIPVECWTNGQHRCEERRKLFDEDLRGESFSSTLELS